MRLTLRTLLAWLDDTLTPAEVRAIGKQVSELDYAKELVERIHKVTRQRRLTIPPRTGPHSADPNLVAAYLDSELEAELVTEFEKKCLTSDVHLAEVASVHQILSLIGQKAKVPVEAKERMYQLVKGREAIRAKTEERATRKGAEPAPQSKAIKPWVMPAPEPRQKGLERFGPIVALLALITILCWSAWVSLSPLGGTVPPVAKNKPRGALQKIAAEDLAKQEPAEAPAAKNGPKMEPPKAIVLAESVAPIETIAPKKEEAKPRVVEKPARTFGEGFVAEAAKPSGLLARFDADKKEWLRLTEDTPARDGDRILSFEPFQSTLRTPRCDVVLVGETEVLSRETPSDLAARVEIKSGRIVLETPLPAMPIEVVGLGTTITIKAEGGQKIGVELMVRREQGSAVFVPPILRFWVAEGSTKLQAAGEAEITLDGPGSIAFAAPATWSEKSAAPAPSWVALTPVEPEREKVGEAFLSLFQPDRTLAWSLVEALESKDSQVALLAIPALRALGDFEYIVPILNRSGVPNSAEARKATIAALRRSIAEGPDSAARVHEQLTHDLGADVANSVEQLLVGFPASAADQLEIWSRLVRVLETKDESDVGLRQLCLDNLMTLSGLGDLGYDPENPIGDGLKSWKKLEADKRAKAEPESTQTPKGGGR